MLSISATVQKIRRRQISACEVLNEYVKKIAQNKHLNAYVTLFKERAYNSAKRIDKIIQSGNSGGGISANEKSATGPLAGIPVAIKDNMLLKGTPTTCGSKILKGYISPYTATAVKKLEEAGAVIIGKTNMDEFAMGSSGENSAYGPTLNPHDTKKIPGGSSSGSAVAVASGGVMASLGSDTGGSIRQPAAMCGVVGMKPTYGLVSRYGLVAFASSLDQIGQFASNVTDAAIMLSVISGYDAADSTSLNIAPVDYMKDLNCPVKGITFGMPQEYFAEGLSEEIKNRILDTAKELEKEGAVIKEVSLPSVKYAIAAYYIVAPAEASANLARYDGVRYGERSINGENLIDVYSFTREQGFGSEVKRRIMIGAYALSSGYYEAYYLKAQKVRTLIKQDFENVFKEVDLILSPTTPETAFNLGEKTDDPLKMYLSDIYTISANLAGIPAISVPAGNDSKGLPIGSQITGPYLSEKILLRAARGIEKIHSAIYK